MKLRVNRTEILVFCLLAPIYRPPFFDREAFSFLDVFFESGKIVSAVICLFLFLRKRIFEEKVTNKILQISLYFSFFAIILLSGFLTQNITEIGSAFLPVITIIMLYLAFEKDNVLLVIKPLCLILSLYTFINFSTTILFPEGLYFTKYNEYGVAEAKNWFLGYKNSHIRVMLPALSLSIICDIIDTNSVRLRSKLLAICIIISTVICKSSTAIVGVSIFLVLYFLSMNRGVRIRPLVFIVINYLFFLFIVVLRLQKYFAYFLVNILNKDVTFTGRTYIWDQALMMVLKKPLLGYGATVFRIGNYYSTIHPHNLILYILVKGGVVGLVFFTIISIMCAYKLDKYQSLKIIRILILQFCSFFSMSLVESMTDATFFWLIFIMGLCAESLCMFETQGS